MLDSQDARDLFRQRDAAEWVTADALRRLEEARATLELARAAFAQMEARSLPCTDGQRLVWDADLAAIRKVLP